MFYIYTLASVILVSLISVLGIFAFSLKENIMRKYVFIFMSIAVGALLGDAFIHLIPESFEKTSGTIAGSLIVAGIFFFFILEKFLHWHHHGEDAAETHVRPVGKLILLSDGVHNFLDGMIIAASFSINIHIGIATTLAVILHEIPQEIGDFAVLLHSGYSKAEALRLNFLSALTAIFGALIFFMFDKSAEIISSYILPVAAGGFIYIAAADLMPELHKTKNLKYSLAQLSALVIGLSVMVALAFFE